MKRATLTIKIDYDTDDGDTDPTDATESIESCLTWAADHLASEGLLSEGTGLMVSEWTSEVEVEDLDPDE